MAKVSLRIYNSEIGTLIDQGQIDEAIGHCYHILKTFPKHLETYKLLGKAYLEAKKYAAAEDIFSRVLMSVPNDFVSHVGMSLVADENEKMDDAIWYMQRAFEAQPSNAAVQGELQRLYGRRDGVQPPKIRMTSGALANVYVHGELYPQALAEIMSVEAQDPGRLDMQVLLANTYFRSGQRVKASEIASNLLAKYPYCFDANRILVEILPETSRAESTEIYRHRVNALDPYAAFAKGSIFETDEVPDASISLERLDWHPGDTPQLESGWSDSMGIPEDNDENKEPEWLREDGNAPDPKEDSASQNSPEEGLPDFMREAGWGSSSGAEEPTLFFDSSDPEKASDDDAEEIEEGEMPDWMKSIAPAPEEIAAEENNVEAEEASDEWISDLLGEDSDEESVTEASESEGVVDDALIGALGTSADDQDAAMNWLESLAVNQGAKAEELITDPDARTEDAPEWVKKSQEVSAEDVAEDVKEESSVDEAEEDMPAWLQDDEEKPAAEEIDDMPAWLGDTLEDKEETPVTENVEFSATETEDEFAWLNEADSDEVTDEEIPTIKEETPSPVVAEVAETELGDDLAWLNDMDSNEAVAAEEPSAEKEEAPISDPTIGALGTSADDQDAAMNWLESLAANQGAKAEEMITDPDARTETAPEWVKKSQEVSAESKALEETSESASVQDDQPVEEEVDATPAWLQDDDEVETPVAETEASLSAEEEAPISDPTIGALGTSADDQDAAMNWLESLAANQGAKAEELITDPDARTEDAPDWVKKSQEMKEEEIGESASVEEDNDIPAWMEEKAKGVINEELIADSEPSADEKIEEISMPDIGSLETTEEETPQSEPVSIELDGEVDDAPTWIKSMDLSASENLPPAAEPTPASGDAEDLPGWLADLAAGQKEEVKSEETEEESLPDWMTTEEVAPPEEPLPTQPSEWQPVEEATEEMVVSQEDDTPVEDEKTFGSVSEKLAKEGVLPRKGTVLKKDVELKKPAPPEPKEKVQETPVPKPKRSKRRMDTTMLRDINLMGAQAALDEGNIAAALEEYGKLIKKNRLLDETIFDLREALDDYPVDVSIWQMLGDAYMRAGRLQEAIDSYTNAEKLLR